MHVEEYKLQRKELELKALLEITQAINENQSEEVLVNIFKFTCLVHLSIRSLILYVAKEGDFEQRIAHGVKAKTPGILVHTSVKEDKKTGSLSIQLEEGFSFGELETYLPVYHKEKLLAILFIKQKNKAIALDLDFTQALTNILVVALENKRFARRQLEQEVLKREMEIASQVQQLLFPATLPATQFLKAEVTYMPHSRVGGDYYDLIEDGNGKIYFCIADVSGKGMAAALLMSNFQAALRTLLRSHTDLETLIHQLNFTLFDLTKGERFITFFIGEYTKDTGELQFVNAGHNPPVLRDLKTNSVEFLEAGTTILGAFESLPFMEVGRRREMKDFMLHLFTDGLTEAMNPAEEEFGEERFRELVEKNSAQDPSEFHQEFRIVLDKFTAKVPFHDDLTLLSLCFSSS
uniref:PP2C family protein-serine/threonine phosphatase n=1 Tax=Algoriphagus sp. TaxID=1872435 RepID=UPI0040485DB7